MNKKDVVVLGSSGFAKEVMWIIKENNKITKQWNIMGFIDETYGENNQLYHGYGIIGNDEWLEKYEKEIYVVCGVGNPSLRRKIVSKFLNKDNINFPSIIFPDVVIAEGVFIGKGCIISSNSMLSIDSKIGDFVTVNFDCTVGHDAILRDYVTLNPSVNISGNVLINSETDIGTGTNIIQGITVGGNTIIGAGSVVIRDIPGECTAVGNPAKVIKTRK